VREVGIARALIHVPNIERKKLSRQVRGKENVMNQYERRRISFRLMADVARERGWINRGANRFLTRVARHSTEYATTELPIAIAC
jgi:hypothetical protein